MIKKLKLYFKLDEKNKVFYKNNTPFNILILT